MASLHLHHALRRFVFEAVLLLTNKKGFSQQNEAECVNREWRRSLEGGGRARPASEAAMLKSKLRSAGTAQGHHDYNGGLKETLRLWKP